MNRRRTYSKTTPCRGEAAAEDFHQAAAVQQLHGLLEVGLAHSSVALETTGQDRAWDGLVEDREPVENICLERRGPIEVPGQRALCDARYRLSLLHERADAPPEHREGRIGDQLDVLRGPVQRYSFERLDRTKVTQRLVKRLRDLGYNVQLAEVAA